MAEKNVEDIPPNIAETDKLHTNATNSGGDLVVAAASFQSQKCASNLNGCIKHNPDCCEEINCSLKEKHDGESNKIVNKNNGKKELLKSLYHYCDQQHGEIAQTHQDPSVSAKNNLSQITESLENASLSEKNCAACSDKETIETKEIGTYDKEHGIHYVVYESEIQMPHIMQLITKDLSEPYSIYTYRYFIHNWPKLCFLAKDEEKYVGAIVCKLDMNKRMVRRGYIAMLAVDKDYRRRKIGSSLVLKAIRAMVADDCDEVVLETEITNKAALRLYENLGFVRDKRLFRYYLNGVDALRLKLWLR